MATIDFNMVITDEAVQYAREASINPGWYLIPTRWAISSSSGTLSSTRTTSSMLTTWINEPYSGLEASGTTGILHSIVIPPDAYETEMSIGEIYFIYKDYYGNEFLFAIAQPTSSVIFTPGVSQQYYFLFKLNNVDVSDTIIIDYTYPQDIEDHNQKEDAHDYLLARNGSRTATGILYYESEFDFTENLQIPSKQYVDEADNTINNTINTLSNTVSNLSTTVSNLSTTVSNLSTTVSSQSTTVSNLSNLQNISSTGILNCINWIMPKYSSGSSFSCPYTTTKPGWVYLGGKQDVTSSIYIGGVYFEISFDTGDGQSRGNLFMPVAKGVVISSPSNVRSLVFYPCNGA